MKTWMIAGMALITLCGCAQLTNYASVVKTPPPAELVGNWQSAGPQKGLISDRAIASLIINAQGDTLDCRQWQRVTSKSGKITRHDDQWVNVNDRLRVMPLALKGSELHYDSLTLRKVDRLTPECEQALAAVGAEPKPGL